MKASYKWLCELVPGLEKVPAEELAVKLTFAGLEVEATNDLVEKFKGVVVGEVTSKEKHPNADKLSLCKVSDGKTEYQVVCGAPNVATGKKFPFATLGTVMPGGLEIKPIKLRGTESSGMLCSGKELELSVDAEGIMELPTELKTGEPISEALGLDDIIFELGITPNRGDALSHWGLAAEIAALMGLDSKINHKSAKVSGKCAVTLKHNEKKKCGRFTASEVKGVQIKSSPDWLKNKLESLGIRAINNVVDATNYVMLLTGHPVHAYDARDISDNTITIDTVKKNTVFKTLDGNERKLLEGDLIIGDSKGPVGLAGIMGGENSEIKDDTTDVILEVAFFHPDTIRQTARRLSLHTDSSYRFERFVNPETAKTAHEELRDLIVTLAGGTPTDILDSYTTPLKPSVITLPESEIERLLGITVGKKEVTAILSKLGCDVKHSGKNYNVTPPLSRSDLTVAADIVEEIARLHGLDKIPVELPMMTPRIAKETKVSTLQRQTKDFLVNKGFEETLHYSFGDREWFEKVLGKENSEKWVDLSNALSEELSVMRPSILPHLIQSYLKNHLLSEKGLRFFELRNKYSKSPQGFNEELVLAGLYVGNPYGRNRFGFDREVDVFDGKGMLEGLFKSARIQTTQSSLNEWPYHPGRSLQFSVENKVLAKLGCLHPELLQELKIKERLYCFEVDFQLFASLHLQKSPEFQSYSSLPSVYRDLALLTPEKLSYADIETAIRDENPKHLDEIHLFDLYEGNNLPEGMKSIAISMSYVDPSKSLTDEEVNTIHFDLVEKLKKRLGVDLR